MLLFYILGLTTLSEFQAVVRYQDVDLSLLKLVYGYYVFGVVVSKADSQLMLDSPPDYQWTDLNSTRLQLQLIKDLEAFGLIDLDPSIEELIRPRKFK